MTATTFPTTRDGLPATLPGLRGHARVLRALRRDGIRLAARRRPLDSDSGDFVIATPAGPGRWLVAVGDVMGRGRAAEALAHEIRVFLRARAARASSLAELLRGANHVALSFAEGERFASLLLLLVDGTRRTLRIANAGHCEPLAGGRSGGVVALEGHGPALGILPGAEFREAGPLRLPTGVTLVATTDGVLEAQDARGRMFGREGAARAFAAARASGPRAVVRHVLDEVEAHAAGPLTDPATVVALQFDR